MSWTPARLVCTYGTGMDQVAMVAGDLNLQWCSLEMELRSITRNPPLCKVKKVDVPEVHEDAQDGNRGEVSSSILW